MIEFYDLNDELIDANNPLSFIDSQIGSESQIKTLKLYYGKNDSSLGEISDININAIGTEDLVIPEFWSGTIGNGYKSMLRARSCGAVGVPSDMNIEFSELSPDKSLKVGNMIGGSLRYIEFKLRIPWDFPVMDLTDLTLLVSYN